MKILVTPTSFCSGNVTKAMDLLQSYTKDIIFNPYGRPLTESEIIPLLSNVDGYIAGLDYISAEVINKAPSCLKVISRYGVGYERVDIKAAADKGIVVTNTPGVNSESVADLAFGLLLSVARKISILDKKVKLGEWPRVTGVELYGKTIGILGLGAIGKGVARRAHGFSMKIKAFDPFADVKYMEEAGIENSSLEMLLESSDFITLHLPLNSETKHIIDEKAFSLMKESVILVNTSRGGLIDEISAYKALVSGKIGGLGLDVFEKEPPDQSSLFGLDNVVITPHTGAHTQEAIENMGNLAVKNLIEVLSGENCPNVVNRFKT